MTVLRRVAIGGISLVVAVAGFPTASHADPAADLAAKKREAAAVAAQLEELEEASSIADEQFLQAQLASQSLRAEVAAAQTRVTQTETAMGAAQGQVQAAALRAYVRGAEAGVLPRALAVARAGPDAPLASSGQVYGQVAIGLTQDVVDQLSAARHDNEVQQADLTARLAEQQQAEVAQDQAREAAEASVARQQAKLDSVQGELAELVRQEEARRRAEEERLAREAAARRAAADAAARAAAQQAAAQRAAEAAARRAAAPTTSGSTSTGSTSTGSTTTGSTTGTVAVTPVVTAPVRSPRASANQAVAAALSQVGVPYRYAASTPGVGFDCSGLTMWAWAQAGVSLSHSSAAQFASLTPVPMDQLQPGDLIAFGTPVHHIGMYVGNGQMVHAPQTGRNVTVVSINRRDVRGAVRP